MTANDRAQNELDYLTELLATRGNADVPYESIGSYLDTQTVAFEQMGHPGIASDIRLARECVAAGRYDAAFALMRNVLLPV